MVLHFNKFTPYISFTQGCIVSNLAEIGPVVLEENILKRSLCWTPNNVSTYRIFFCWPLSTARIQRIFFLSVNRLINYVIIKIYLAFSINYRNYGSPLLSLLIWYCFVHCWTLVPWEKNRWPPHFLVITTDIRRNMIIWQYNYIHR